MAELELTRTREDRKLYALEGVGTLRLKGWTNRTATATAATGDRVWELARHGLFKAVVEATDALGSVVGSYEPRTFKRGGTLRWAGRELTLRPASVWRQRYALADGDRELAVFDGRGWGKRPVAVLADDPAALDPGLVLYAAFVVRGLAEDANSAAAGGASAAGVGATGG
jgi:hypothetical protein